MSRRSLMLVNAGFRMAYGIGGLLSPAAMGKLQLAADTPERPDARLFVRGFSAHQIGVAALGLVSLRWQRLERGAAIAAVAIDVADMLSAVVEADQRQESGADLVGGLIFSAAGVVTAAAALRSTE
jgi:hypothetical protein